MTPFDRLTVIATPVHVHGVQSAREYEALHRKQMHGLQRARPALMFPNPWEAGPQTALVSGGKWIVVCVCGNAPSASPDWDVARCFDCGAVYRSIAWPADRARLEAVLCVRPASRRHWMPHETVADLVTENVTHGFREAVR